MGVCMMTDFHLDRAIRMLLKSMDSILNHYRHTDEQFMWEPDYNSCEDKIDMLNRERRRREMVRKGWRHEDGLIAGGATGVSASTIDHYINGDMGAGTGGPASTDAPRSTRGRSPKQLSMGINPHYDPRDDQQNSIELASSMGWNEAE